MTLAHTYLRWVHPSFPFLEQLSLLDAIDAFYALENDGSNYQLLSNGWPSTLPSFRWNGKPTGPENAGEQDASLSSVALIVFMVLSVGALVQVRSKVYEFPPQKYYRTALKFSKDAFSRTSLSSIQALIMLVVHGMMTPSRVNLWTLVHLGLASCVDIGIHREPTQVAASDFALQQMRRYVFFTIYSLDR